MIIIYIIILEILKIKGKKIMKKTLLSFVSMALLANISFADEIKDLQDQIQELQENQQALIDETSNLKTGFSTVDTSFSHNGMGAAASKVYTSNSALSIGGYGDMYVKMPDNGDAKADVYHFVPYIGYKFSDNIILNTELEFEHGGSNAEAAEAGDADAAEGYAIVEFMYLDFLINKSFNIQLGKTLVPMGLINLRHEPTLFNSVQKPLTEKYIIPGTWAATGVNTYGSFEEFGISYNAGITQALELNNDASSTHEQIRAGRPSPTGKTDITSIAFVGRLDYTGVNGLLAGASFYYGDAFIYDIHATYEISGFRAKALYAATSINNAENIANANTTQSSIDSSNGYYINLEYDALASFATAQKVPFFLQYDHVSPSASVTNKFGVSSASLEGEKTTTTFGLNYFPQEQVVLKMDYAMTNIALKSAKDFTTFSLGLGFIF